MVYFYDNDKRYIGCRELKQGETVPQNATAIPVAKNVGEQAHFIDGKWVISQIPAEPIVETVAEPSTEEVLNDLIQLLADKGVIF